VLFYLEESNACPEYVEGRLRHVLSLPNQIHKAKPPGFHLGDYFVRSLTMWLWPPRLDSTFKSEVSLRRNKPPRGGLLSEPQVGHKSNPIKQKAQHKVGLFAL